MFRSVSTLCCVSLLAGCATHAPEAFHPLPALPKTALNIAGDDSPPAIEDTPPSTSGYREWSMSSQSQYMPHHRHRIDNQYVQDHWLAVKEMGEQDVFRCVQDTERRISQMGSGQWTYVVGKGYTKSTAYLPHAPACWSRLSTMFEGKMNTDAAQVGPDNPLTRYDSALTQWTESCQTSAITASGLESCLKSSWIPTIQARKAAIHRYLKEGDSLDSDKYR